MAISIDPHRTFDGNDDDYYNDDDDDDDDDDKQFCGMVDGPESVKLIYS